MATGFSGRLKINLCEERRLKDTHNCLVLKAEDLATKPEYGRFEFLTGNLTLKCDQLRKIGRAHV